MTSPHTASASFAAQPPPLPPPLPPLPPKAESLPANPAVLVCGLDSTKLTWREWWRTAPGPIAVIGWCATLLRNRILDDMRLLVVRDAAALEISMEQLSECVRQKLLSQMQPLRALGFGDPRFMHVTDVFTNREVILAVQLHASGKTVARTLCAYPLPGAITKKTMLSVGFLSAFVDGRMLCTDEKRPKFMTSPRVLTRWKAGSVRARYEAHAQAMARSGDAVVLPADKVWALCDAYETELISCGQSRGLLVPLSDAEGARVLACASPDEARHTAALAELVRLQTARPRSIAGVVLLVVSLAVFAATGALSWSWEICAIIGTALFVHEFGHYVAMRWFNYRDLRMFFIPLLGAAVTGKNENVAGWKKAVVYLMGPLPGIVLGTGMAVGAVALGKPAIANAAMIVIGLNLFNLLPLLPLDGGGFWNAVLFCRHRWLEAAFKSVAGVALMVCGLAGGIWLVLGISMLRSVPKTLRLSGAAERLRQRGWQSGSSHTISPEAAETILAELKLTTKNPPAARTAAAEALHVFEHLNARPPSALASFGLIASYAAAIVIALVGLGTAGFATIGNSNKVSAHRNSFGFEHAPVLSAEFHGELAQFPASPRDQARRSRRIIATFPDASSATGVLEKVWVDRSGKAEIVQFGQTLIAVVGWEDKITARELSDRFRQERGTVLDTGSPLTVAVFNLQFSARDSETAAQLSRDLQTYFTLPLGMRPVAPWTIDSAVKPEERAEYMKAATTYARILEADAQTLESPELEEYRQINWLTLLKSRKAMRESAREFAAKRQRLQREAVKKLRASGDPTLDDRVIDLVLRQPKPQTPAEMAAWEEWRMEMRRLVTGCPDGDRETSTDGWVAARISVAGERITLQFHSLPQPEQTLPALARYFAEWNCADVHYGFHDVAVADVQRFAALDR